MADRRAFLHQVIGLGLGGVAASASGLDRVRAAVAAAEGTSAADAARDEALWAAVQNAFTVDRSVVNLNNGGVCPSPRVVQEAVRRYLDLANTTPALVLNEVLLPKVEAVRAQLARAFGCGPDELAVTRNASEALETLIFGLELERGDEVVVTDHNYPRMVQSWRQRERRDGINLVTVEVPANPRGPEELVDAFARAITPKTRVIEVCHVTNLNGQIYPVKEIAALGRARGIEVIVDGAHAFGHFPFRLEDLGCDFYGTSLHKWLLAPHGTGFLYVRKERIKDVWPLMAAPEGREDDVRKFEEIGTHPIGLKLAVSEALAFHHAIGAERKAERLRFLSRRWIGRLAGQDRVHLLTNDAPAESCGLRLVAIDGLPARRLAAHLLAAHQIVVCPIVHPRFEGIRITPNVYTTLEELDRFADAVLDAIRRGIP